jgi:hypothetical protein
MSNTESINKRKQSKTFRDDLYTAIELLAKAMSKRPKNASARVVAAMDVLEEHWSDSTGQIFEHDWRIDEMEEEVNNLLPDEEEE